MGGARAIEPRGPVDARIRPPGSKSISNRALVTAALARGTSRLRGLLASEDIDVMREALVALGATITPANDEPDIWRVEGTGGSLRVPDHTLDVHASGTATRFLTAVATLAPGPVQIDGTPRLRERPVRELVDALRLLGAEVTTEGPGGCPPVRTAGGGLEGGNIEIDARRSSQYVSAVLLAAPYARRDVRLSLRGGVLASRPYVDVTLRTMRDFGVAANGSAGEPLEVPAGQAYAACDYAVESDASTAAYFFCAAAIAGGRVRVENLPGSSCQADLGLLAVLEQMGCAIERGSDSIELTGPAEGLRGVDVDMNAMPDAVLALSVTALFARGHTLIRNVGHLRIKESDRLAALETELRKLGVRARATADALAIEPGPLSGAAIDTYDDHRMAMAFALAGLRVPGVVIRDPDCVAKSWPKYFDALAGL